MVKGKYGHFKNRFERFLASENGRRAFNFAYSWGAAIVVAGVMFKHLHIRGADVMLAVGMSVEVVMFFISAFDYPAKDYRWEEVFPVLKTDDATDRPVLSSSVHVGPNNRSRVASPSTSTAPSDEFPEWDGVTQSYLTQLEQLSENMRTFNESTVALTSVSNNLLASFQSASGESNGVIDRSRSYVNQMEMLNKNLSGLNTIYEIQLKSISSQIDTIDQINGGLNRIKEMYANTSSNYCEESEKMTRQMADLNAVYSRMLEAMSMNMQPGGGSRPTQEK